MVLNEQYELSKAEALYAEGNFEEAGNICLALLKQNPEQESRISSLAARSFLFMFNTRSDETHKKTFYYIAGRAYSSAKTAEDALRVEYELAEAAVKWYIEKSSAAHDYIRRNPTIQNLKLLYDVLMPSAAFVLYGDATWLCMADHPSSHFGKITKEDREQAKAKFGEAAQMPSSDVLIAKVQETAEAIAANALDVLANNDAGSYEFVERVCITVDEMFFVALSILDLALPNSSLDSTTITPKTKYQCLRAKTKIIATRMNATTSANGQAHSVLQDASMRAEQLKEFDAANKKLCEILPDYEPISRPSATAHTFSKGGCYVATAVYGSYDCPEVWTLRRFRDNTLASTWYGRAFIRTYYAISPTLVKWFGNTQWFKNLWRGKLDKMVNTLQKQGVESTPYQDKNW